MARDLTYSATSAWVASAADKERTVVSFRILLSPPHLDGDERELLVDALESNWIAPLGPHVDAFEAEVAERVGRRHAVALSSGTAALHLALLTLGVGPGDEVLVPTLTFAATANAVAYTGATPVFVDADPISWNLDIGLVEEELSHRATSGRRQPATIIPVDLYGRCADYTALVPVAERYGVPVVEDAAEALGATHDGQPAGSFGKAAAFSFNGNKIITTSGGGMLVTDDGSFADRVRHLATQAREPALHYEHRDVGFNYRLSNLLAAVGRGQLARLDAKVERRRGINARYRAVLKDLPGLSFPTEDSNGLETCWLTTLTVDPANSDASRDRIIAVLAEGGIEARPLWKPMHLQPVFGGASTIGGAVAAELFASGLCLPSGSALTDDEVDEIAALIQRATG
jgi:dTDP-4-amino-4,6-dideoxygalactose transaminase